MVKSDEAILVALAEMKAERTEFQAEVLRAIAAINAQITTFLTGGVREFADADVIEALQEAMKQHPFTAGRAMAYAKHQKSPQALALAGALDAAFISEAQGLGILLKRCENRPTGTIAVLRVDDGRKDRVTWQLRPLKVLGLLGSLESPA